MATVKDLKNVVESMVASLVISRSSELFEFWRKLNMMGARNIRTHPPEVYQDIDATVELSKEEYKVLMDEFNSLLINLQTRLDLDLERIDKP